MNIKRLGAIGAARVRALGEKSAIELFKVAPRGAAARRGTYRFCARRVPIGEGAVFALEISGVWSGWIVVLVFV